jgi:hypothetical protein
VNRNFIQGKEHLCRRGVVLPKYILYFKLQHGTIFYIHSSVVYHGIKKNIEYTEVKVTLTNKAKVAIVGSKKQKTIKDDIE